MELIVKKILLASLLLLMLSFSACEKDCKKTNSCAIEETCSAKIINTADYFQTDKVLTNHCTVGEGVDYIIEAEAIYGYYDVTAKLKVEKGTTIIFKDGAGLAVSGTGSLTAVGMASAPIIFRGDKEASVGSWKGIYISSDQIANELDYVIIKGAGGNGFNSNDNRGNVVVYADAKVRINNCTLVNSASYGVNADYATANITSFMNNKFENNHTPIIMHGNNVDIIDATNRFSGNTNQYVHTRVSYGNHEIASTKIWQALAVPYRMISADFGIFKHQEVGSNGRLTINPGVVIEFDTQTGFDIDDTATFSAVGTANNRIKFRGVDPTMGSWDGFGFSFTQSPSNEIGYADIEHAGSNKGAIDMWGDPFINVHDVHFKDIAACVFYDSPKFPQDPVNPKLTRTNITYSNVANQYCKGSN